MILYIHTYTHALYIYLRKLCRKILGGAFIPNFVGPYKTFFSKQLVRHLWRAVSKRCFALLCRCSNLCRCPDLCLVLSCLALSYLVLSCLVLSYLISSCITFSGLVSSRLTLYSLVLSHLVLSCGCLVFFVLFSCLASAFLVLSCLVLS